jgi:NAD(P)-dependent dehydrogenase (short-subunit alcohol dehydrogenase family)
LVTRVAVVTGGAGGLGIAAAKRLGAGHALVLADRADEPLAAAQAALAAEGIDAVTVHCDVSSPADVAHLVEIVGGQGELAVLAHTAGVSPSMADARRILEVNLVGTANLLDAVEPLLVPGTVAVCAASISGHRTRLPEFDELLLDPRAGDFFDRIEAQVSLARPGVGYALSKRGVVLQVEQRAQAWGRRGARIVSVSPGLIGDTPMGRLEKGAGARKLESVSALGRAAGADEIAALIAFLASGEAGFITGTDVRIDGGAVAGYRHHTDTADREQWDDPWHAEDPWRRETEPEPDLATRP